MSKLFRIEYNVATSEVATFILILVEAVYGLNIWFKGHLYVSRLLIRRSIGIGCYQLSGVVS